jgi:hypothetical protein
MCDTGGFSTGHLHVVRLALGIWRDLYAYWHRASK